MDQREIGDFDICICCRSEDNKEVHTSFIRVRRANDKTTGAIVRLGSRLVDSRMKGNARTHSGDKGQMYASGSRHKLMKNGRVLQYKTQDFKSDRTVTPTATIKRDEAEYDMGHNITSADKTRETIRKDQPLNERITCMNALNNEAIRFLREEYNELLSTFQCIEASSRNNETKARTVQTNTRNEHSVISSGMNFTVDLWNASHYDVNDGSYSIGIWASDGGKDVEDWELVLPNVYLQDRDDVDTCQSKDSKKPSVTTRDAVTTAQPKGITNDIVPPKGTTIRLFHGCAISWEGTEIRHATSRKYETKGNEPLNHTYSAFWCTSKEQHRLLHTLCRKKEEDKTV